MTDIKFDRDYGYFEGSPFWLVGLVGETGDVAFDRVPSRAAAEEQAAIWARTHVGRDIWILAPIARVSTSSELVGKRFDPAKLSAAALDAAEEIRKAPDWEKPCALPEAVEEAMAAIEEPPAAPEDEDIPI